MEWTKLSSWVQVNQPLVDLGHWIATLPHEIPSGQHQVSDGSDLTYFNKFIW